MVDFTYLKKCVICFLIVISPSDQLETDCLFKNSSLACLEYFIARTYWFLTHDGNCLLSIICLNVRIVRLLLLRILVSGLSLDHGLYWMRTPFAYSYVTGYRGLQFCPTGRRILFFVVSVASSFSFRTFWQKCL